MVSNDFMTVFEVNCFIVLIDQLIYKDIRNGGELTRILVSANEAHHILFHVGQMLYSVFFLLISVWNAQILDLGRFCLKILGPIQSAVLTDALTTVICAFAAFGAAF